MRGAPYINLVHSCCLSNDQSASMILQISGYISGSSPHIRSGAVSALSVLIYKDPEICLSSPELLSSVLSLLHTKSIEIIKVSPPFSFLTSKRCSSKYVLSVFSSSFSCIFVHLQAVLGFVKVLVSTSQAQDLQSLLQNLLFEILPWSSVSRHYFRSKVINENSAYM